MRHRHLYYLVDEAELPQPSDAFWGRLLFLTKMPAQFHTISGNHQRRIEAQKQAAVNVSKNHEKEKERPSSKCTQALLSSLESLLFQVSASTNYGGSKETSEYARSPCLAANGNSQRVG